MSLALAGLRRLGEDLVGVRVEVVRRLVVAAAEVRVREVVVGDPVERRLLDQVHDAFTRTRVGEYGAVEHPQLLDVVLAGAAHRPHPLGELAGVEAEQPAQSALDLLDEDDVGVLERGVRAGVLVVVDLHRHHRGPVRRAAR